MAAEFSFHDIVKATGGVWASAAPDAAGFSPDKRLTGVSTDTRTLQGGEIFFALKGETHDAHDHLDKAVAGGALALVVSDVLKAPAGFAGGILAVADVLRAYQDLAAYYRNLRSPFVIAVTGSVGKTTLKDMIACIMSAHFRKVNATKGNLNNQVGLPRTILESDMDTDALALEMGMAGAGEIRRLAEIAKPDVCAITNIGLSHRENFDSDDGILKAKYEITTMLGPGGALAIETSGSEALAALAEEGSREKGYDLLRVAAKGTAAAAAADYVFTPVRVDEDDVSVARFEVYDRAYDETVPFAIPVPGAYASLSAALAVAVCARAGILVTDAADALAGLSRAKHRLEPVRRDGLLVIDDTYNASPDSAKSGLVYLSSVPAKRRIAVLADMNELGSASGDLHAEVGAAAALAGADRIYAFGEKAWKIAEGARGIRNAAGTYHHAQVYWFGADEKDKLIADLREEVRKGDVVYVKGSRSMKMEEVVIALTEGV